MKNQCVIGSFLLAIFFAMGCDSRQQINQQYHAVQRPLKHVETPLNVLQVDPSKGGEFHFKTGTVIQIPEHAFVDKSGKIIEEPVMIELEEFHSASDIFLSGITMHYEQNGVDESFESAGMFRIDGSCNGEQIEVAKGKTLNVQLASSNKDSNYDFFQLNEKTAKWERLSATSASVNQSRQTLADSIQKIAKSDNLNNMPNLPEKGALVLDIDVDYRKYPQLRDFYGLAWQVESSENAKELSDVQWDYTNLISTGTGINDFKLRLSNAGQIKEVKVQPVISREERARLEKRYELARIEVEKARAIALQNATTQMDAMFEFQRNLSVNGFGIYNCDRVIQYEQPVALEPNYILNGIPIKNYSALYLISNDNSAVAQYLNTIKFDLGRENKLVFVLNDGKLGYVSNDQLVASARKSEAEKKDLNIEIKVSKSSIKTPQDLQAFLNRI